MLYIEKLVCRNPNYHLDCRWKPLKRRYANSSYPTLRRILLANTLSTGVAYRVWKDNRRVVLILKKGHDGNPFIMETI